MTEKLPQRVEGLEVHEVDDGFVVYQDSTDRVHYLNPTASVVFELCTGERSDADIEELVRVAWALREPPSEEVRACLAQLRSEGMIE